MLVLPRLRDLADDVPEIAGRLLAQFVESRLCPPRQFSTAALNLLRGLAWPRNLEELQQVVRSAAVTAMEDEIGAADVERVIAHDRDPGEFASLPLDLPLREAREAFERAYFEHHLSRDTSISRLAETSGLERTHLYRKLKALGIGTGGRKDD